MLSLIIILLIMCLTLAGSFFFSISESSIVASNPVHLKRLSDEGHRGANIAYYLISNRRILFGTLLLGNNISVVAFSSLGESMMGRHHEGLLWLIVSIIIFDGIVLIFGEIIPKMLALNDPERVAQIVAPSISFLGKILNPLIKAVHFIPGLILSGIQPELTEQPLVTENQIKLAFVHGSKAGIMPELVKDFGLKVVDAVKTTVERVMTSRADIVSLPAEMSIRDAFPRIREKPFTRIPIYENNDEDNITGFVNIIEVLGTCILNDYDKKLGDFKHDITFVPEEKAVFDMMLDFKDERYHIAMVIDEAGSIVGLVTIEDLIQEVVGEIYGEYEDEWEIKKISDDTFVIYGRILIRELNEELLLNLDDSRYGTISGYVTGLFGKVPEEGMSIEHEDIVFTVEKIHKRRIDQLKIKIKNL